MPPYSTTHTSYPGEITSAGLLTSGFYELKQLCYNLPDNSRHFTGFNSSLCMVYVRRGSFLLDYFIRSYDMPPGYILLDKPGYEYTIRPSEGHCTIINFTDDFLRQYTDEMNMKTAPFFSNPDMLSVVLQSRPELDYLHYQLMQRLQVPDKLATDCLVLEFFTRMVNNITNITALHHVIKKNQGGHILSVEAAKEYIQQNFTRDISLQEIAESCYVSLFHFSRLFKSITSISPYKYLQQVRLKHAEMLLKTTCMPVADVAYTAGFNSPAYFATSFRQVYKDSPQNYRSIIKGQHT